jgi:hypothetical protein
MPDRIQFDSYKSLSASAPRRSVEVKILEDVPADIKAAVQEGRAKYAAMKRRFAEMEKQGRTPQRFESNVMNATNVATLSHDRAVGEMEYIKNIIQDGSAAKYVLQAANGDKTTSSFQEYLGWLQAHVKALEDDGTYSQTSAAQTTAQD